MDNPMNNNFLHDKLNEEIKKEISGIDKNEGKIIENDNMEISNTFLNLEKELAEELESKKKEEMASEPEKINIKIDLNNLEIFDGNELELSENTDIILNSRGVTQVVCCQSAYSAQLSALKHQEIQNLNDADVDIYNYKKRIYKAIYKHIEETSVGKMDFNSFLRNTSYFDTDTLLYGLYAQTFPYKNKYNIPCPKDNCAKNFEIEISNATLIETRGKEEDIYSKINEVVNKIKNPKELLANSHIHTSMRIMLEETKMVFVIRIPSIYDYLEEILGNVKEDVAEEYATSLGAALFVEEVYVPNIKRYRETGKFGFFPPVKDKEKIIRYISELPYYDGIQLTEAINDFTDKYRIVYSIKNVVCPHCGYEIGEIPMNMEEVLFLGIRQGRTNGEG
jgi:hypothetical protein